MNLHEFDTREAAGIAVAQRLATSIEQAVTADTRAAIALGGGESPKACYRHLASLPLPWDQLDVTLTDERVVPDDHPDSNARMLRECLLFGPAQAAELHPIDSPNSPVHRTLAGVLLGMGPDGHFASLFPDAANLAAGLKLPNAERVLAVSTAASPHARISMTLAALLDTSNLLLMIFGAEKRAVLEQPDDLPVAALLKQTQTPVDVFWAP